MELIQSLILLVIGGAVTYFFQRRTEALKAERAEIAAERARLDAARARLLDERRHTYTTLLDPYIEVLTELGRGLPATEANERLGSVDHRKAAFQLKMLGTDAVVRAFNSFARYIVDAKITQQEQPGEILRRFAALIYAIRRDLGEPNAELGEVDMIFDWVADIGNLYPDVREAQTLHTGALTLRAEAASGSSVRIEGREIHMHRLEELRNLALKFREGTATDEELIQIFQRIPDAPGAEVLEQSEAVLVENGTSVSPYRPREYLDALRRREAGTPIEGDVEKVGALIRFMKSIRGRRVQIVNPHTGQNFEIRA